MTDATLATELAREQAHVDRAYARLEQLRMQAKRHERETLGGPRAGTPQSLYERDVTALAAASRRADLDDAGEGLVFGRLDRGASDDGPADAFHIGRLGLRTEEQQPIVVDWRAPAAAAFYRATAADPQGVVRRRSLTTRGTTVTGLEDELLVPEAADQLEGTVVIGDGAFLAAVSRERGPHMRDIVATIQREQDEAVRAPDDGALVVTGGPGTGKTAVALHRVAYLMYARREWYGRRGVLVVGPSPVFVDYIGAVLPALGETSVRLAALGQVPVLPRGITVDRHDLPEAVAVKGSARMAGLLRRAVDHLAHPAELVDLEVDRYGTPLLVDAAELRRRRTAASRGVRSSNASRQAFVSQAVDAAWRVWERRPGATRIEADDREDFAAWIRREPAFVAAVERAWPLLSPADVFAAMPSLPLERLSRGAFDADELAALRSTWSTGASVTDADAALLDELAELIGPPPPPEVDEDDDWDEMAELEQLAQEKGVTTFADRTRQQQRNLVDDLDHRTYAHVVVDEAQDVTPMQWRMLGRRARGATWTVVGDWAQSAWPDVEEVREGLQSALGRARVREAALTTNYRTSTEIASLAARLLARIDPKAAAPAAVRTSGIAPLFVADLASAVSNLLEQVGGTVGVVVPAAAAASVRRSLPEHPRLSVVDTWQVKGLEYDGCVVVDPYGVVAEALSELAGLRSLYVALTRATQRLVVVTDRDLRDLLDGPPLDLSATLARTPGPAPRAHTPGPDRRRRGRRGARPPG